ncbi:MAG: serine hydrolase domain-containing protein [Myxococcota bacterium]
MDIQIRTGFSAAVSIKGRVVWAGAVGFADIASARPVTPDTRFRIDSTSKALTATALARLVQRGQVDAAERRHRLGTVFALLSPGEPPLSAEEGHLNNDETICPIPCDDV